jgi:hypothetical protein
MNRGMIILIVTAALIATPIAIAAIHGPVYPVKLETKDKKGLVSGISRFSKKGEAPK